MSNISDLNCDVHLHAEIEILKQALVDKQAQLIAMETTCMRESDRQVELEDSIIAWQDKYDRLYESHKRVQKVNQNLEDKLLKLVDRNSGERAQLTSDVATLSVRLAQANYNIATLQRDIERYKTDMSLAIQLLQCKPDSFVSQKVTSLPLEIQSKVSQYMRLDTNSHSDSEGSTSGVGVATSNSYRVLPASDSPPPLCPFPPTAMVYAMRGNDETTDSDRMISPSLMAKYLQDELKASEIKHCDTCLCSSRDLTVLADTAQSYSVSTQTILQGDTNNALCLRCNSNLNSPSRTNSPYIMKLVKSSDSVISVTKSSVSDPNDNDDELFVPTKKDDLMVNPILGHHRLCDRTVPKQLDQSIQNTASTKFIDILQIENETATTTTLITRPSTAVVTSTVRQMKSSPMKLKTPTPPILANTLTDDSNNNGVEFDGERKNDTLPGINNSQNNTTSGSTNSLWSKSSSSGNAAKIFESFNRNLIKSIKVENPNLAGPRLCALRIQNGSSNILLNNIESDIQPPIVYTRRSRFLDEELDETKDIITSSSSTAEQQPQQQQQQLVPNCSINSDNKTDYEKYRDVNLSTAEYSVVSTKNIPPQQQQDILQNKNSIIGLANESNLSTKYHLNKLENETISSRSAIKSCTQSSTISSEPDIQENTLLRCQQLTRVAEWVQNNHLDQTTVTAATTTVSQPIISSQSNSSMECSAGGGGAGDGNSTDSGYKTKPNNCNQNLVVAINTNDIIVASIKDATNKQRDIASSPLSDDTKLIGNTEFAQINNNFIKTNIDGYNHQMMGTMGCVVNGSGSAIDVGDTFNGNTPSFMTNSETIAQIDFAQMEYNVKQFLLKQNEWSITNSQCGSTTVSCTNTVCDTTNQSANNLISQKLLITSTTNSGTNIPQQTSMHFNHHSSNKNTNTTMSKNPHRTETNL